MKLLRQCGIDVISFSRLVDVLEGRASAPARAAVITFDDGWENEYRHAFPVLRKLGLTATFFVFTAPIGRESRFLTWDQLREMHDAGMSIESHSRTHPMLSHDMAGLGRELAGSRRDIAMHLGESPQYFAYPFGNENARVVAAVQAAGYLAARGFGGGTWNTAKSVWDIRSVEVTDNMKAFRRALSVSGSTAACPSIGDPRAAWSTDSLHHVTRHRPAVRIGA
jgi:peptidoglycan/xylan/chitin deacetylase (PgdA/CDA1 family)